MPKSGPSKELASKVFSRTIHFIITLGVFAVLLSTDTVLRIQIENGNFILPSAFVVATVTSLVLYSTVSFMDPGFVKRSDPDVKEISLVLDDCDNEVELYEVKTSLRVKRKDDTSDDERQSMLTNGNAEQEQSSQDVRFNMEPNQRCGFCGLERPLRARHCRECKHCVRKFDHHCPWVANCVGEKNHRWFWTFLAFETLLISWSIYISMTGYRSSGSSKEWLNHNVLLLLVDIILVIFLFIAGSLCMIHTYMVLSNHTTWESMSRHRITYLNKIAIDNPFNMGSCKNVYVFFCYCKPFDWHAVYDLRVSKTQFSGKDKETCSPVNEDRRSDSHL